MKYDIYIPQTESIFEESDTDAGIWLTGLSGYGGSFLEDVVNARFDSFPGESKCIDIVLRVHKKEGDRC